MKVYTEPRYDYTQDHGEGGIKQVIRHVMPYLERAGVTWADTPDQADVIWYHASPYATTAHWLRTRPDVPVVASTHGLYWAEYDWDLASIGANADVIEGLRLADVVTAPSEWVANAIHRGILADVTVVPHGVDLKEFKPPRKHDGYALYDKTRVDPVCDPTPVIALARRLPDVRFVMTGDPVVELPNVMTLGRIPYEAARDLTRSAGVYLAVTRETFGLATLQAMAAGVPVVGYAYGGQVDICGTPEHGGLLVAPGDIDALAEAVVQAQAERATLGSAARARAGAFTWQRAADGYLQAFRAALAAHESLRRCSVIVAAYNAEKTIKRTIDSALAALGPNDQLIVVNDGSTDGTASLIEASRDAHSGDGEFWHVNREENGYLAQARNSGLRLAKGRYVTCLDADDELTPDALNVLAGELDKDRTTQIAYGRVKFVDDTVQADGTITTTLADYSAHDPNLRPGQSGWPFAFDWGIQSKGDNVTCLPYSAMVRTAWLRRAGGWRTRRRTMEDLDLWMRLISYGARPRMVTEADVLTYHTSVKGMSVTEPHDNWAAWYPWTGAAGYRCTPPWGVPAAPPEAMRARAWPVSHHAEPRVSVIIPVGPGHERYVLDAIDSVNAQTLRRWECIVVANTAGELPALPGWVRLVDGTALEGVARVRNAGIEVAQAPLVVFLDADDYLDNDALEHMVETIDQNPKVATVYPDYWERDPVPSTERPGRVEWVYKDHELPDWDCDWARARPGTIHGITAVYRTEALRRVGGFDVEAAGWEDGDLQMALTYAGYCSARLARRAYVYCRDRGAVGTWHYEDYQERAAKITAWLRQKYERRESMACNSCGGGKARVSSPVMDSGGDAIVLTGDMVEVVYTGGRSGDFTLRGATSGTMYRFGKGRHERKPVLREDVAYFTASDEFRVENEGALQKSGAPPALSADGPPSGRRAAIA